MDFLKFTESNKSTTKHHVKYNNIKIGQFIKVHYLPGSLLNSYKGYIGEVREYKQGQEHALITLHALNTQRPIRMSIEHFHPID